MDKKYSWLILSVILLITLLCFFPLRNLKFDFDIEKFFPAKDPDLAFFQNFNERFSSEIDDEYIFIGLSSKRGIFNRPFLEKVDSLTKYINSLDNIINAYSITNLTYFYSQNDAVLQDKIVHISQPELYKSDSIKLFESTEYRKMQVSKDGKSTAISAFNIKGLSTAQKDIIINSINAKIEALAFDKSYFTAKIRVEKTFVSETEKNLKIYLVLSTLIIALTLFFLFRSAKDILVPFACIIISLIWTLALIALFGYPLDIISSLLPPILVIICMSDIIHISIRYKEEVKKGFSKEIALKRTFKDIGPAVFLTSVTIAVGFFSLCNTNIIPVRIFGLFAGIGVMIEYIVTIGFMWAINNLTPVPSTKGFKTIGWEKFLSSCFLLLIKNKYRVFLVTFLFLALSVFFISKIQVNRSLLREIPKNNPILESYKFIENQFAGTRSFEMQLTLPENSTSFYDINVLREIDEIEKYVEDSMKVGFLISPGSFFKSANKVFTGGGNTNYTLPKTQEDLAYCYKYLALSSWGKDMGRYITTDGKYARMSGKLTDLTTKEFDVLSEKFDAFFTKRQKPFHFTYKLTGSSILFDKISLSLVTNMIQGLAMGFILISLIGFFIFRGSVKMGLIMLIPNVVPIVFVAAVMGILGVWLKEDTSVIFSIALGLAVDNTIHFVSKFKLELEKGKSALYAVKRTYLSVGKAMIVTTIILFAGFLTLLFSTFGGTYYIGLLISLCIVFALVADLTITPLLLLFFYKKRKKTVPIETSFPEKK